MEQIQTAEANVLGFGFFHIDEVVTTGTNAYLVHTPTHNPTLSLLRDHSGIFIKNDELFYTLV